VANPVEPGRGRGGGLASPTTHRRGKGLGPHERSLARDLVSVWFEMFYEI
jgi:hypothetical protein